MTTLLRTLAFLVCLPCIQAAPLSGTKSVGPSGDYVSLTVAIADVKTQTLSGPLVLELQPTYLSTVETFPLVFSNLTTTATNTLTVRPQTGAINLLITSADTTAATVDLNGGQFLTIDGRPGGVGSNAGSGGGSASQLTIANTSTSGVAVRFINESSGNALRYTTFRGVNTSGTIVFSTTTGANGNDNNTIDHCDIRDGASTPAKGIYALGTTTTAASNNSGNSVSNCNIFNFYASVDTAGIRLDGGNTDWTIAANSFYQTGSRASVSTSARAIYVNNPSGNNFTVTGNSIGGDSPGATVTTQKWTATGTQSYRFTGIRLNVGSTPPSNVQGNTIANIVWSSNYGTGNLSAVWSGIYLEAGSANIGTLAGNTVGSGSGTGSVSVTSAGNGALSFGIGSLSSGNAVIANNTVGSITVNGTATSISASFYGIVAAAGVNTISNNAVGSATTANSVNAATLSTSTAAQSVVGISVSDASISAIVTDNTVANLNNNYVGTDSGPASQIGGIRAGTGVNSITGNTVRNLSTSAIWMIGIGNTSSAAAQIVSQNTVHSLASTSPSAAVYVSGIWIDGFFSGPNHLARNLVHSLAASSTSAASKVYGMDFSAGTFTAKNNMVRVGLKADGTSTAGASQVRGINDNGNTVGRNFYHNSVYLGGSQTSGASATAAFASVGASNTRTFQNNIFVNARTNSGGTGKHYAVIHGGTGVNPGGLTSGGNIYFASGIGGVLGSYDSVDRTTLAAWQAATGQDSTSAMANPLFANPTGTAATMDLHLQASNPAESGGIPLTGILLNPLTNAPTTVTEDFDGQPRSTLTPVDIGADAGNFTVSTDLFAPAVSYPLLTSGSSANRVLNGWATITDAVGVSAGARAPRLYFKKSTDADVFGVANNSTGNGWKYVTATGSGPYNFTLDYSLINGGSVALGDSIQYFVVAQDAANRFTSNPVGATASANPPVQNVNGHGAVNSFSIVTAISGGTVTVGSGGTYPSLSGPDGLFTALNGAVLAGNIVANITSDLSETGSVTLKELKSNNYPLTMLTLQPDSAVMRTVSGNVYEGLITFDGADRVIIDGSFSGGGRYLTFRNTFTGTTASTLLFINDASNNSIRNCIVEGMTPSTTLGVIGFSTGMVTGNDNNLITGCQVRDRSDATGAPPYSLIGSTGSSSTVANSGNTVSNNEVFNFNFRGIFIDTKGNESWTLSGNDVYETKSSPLNNGYPIYAIYLGGHGNNFVSGNSIHDLLTNSAGAVGIYFNGTDTATVTRNRIATINVNRTSNGITGISTDGSASSTINVVNNQITLSPAVPSAKYFGLTGLADRGPVGSVVNILSNSIFLGGTSTSGGNTYLCYRQYDTTHTARNNIFLNFRTGAVNNNSVGVGSVNSSGNYTASNNVYACSWAFSMEINGTNVNLETWQREMGEKNSQAGIAGSGNFTDAMFVNTSTGDLHLIPGGNPLVNALGIRIPSVIDDYDGDPRPAGAPTIGSDEFVPSPDIAVGQTSMLIDGVGSVDFGSVTLGSSSTRIFTITNSGSAALTSLAVTGGSSEFAISALSGTSVPIGSSSVTFSVTFTPAASGARNATLQIASNVIGTKNPFDIALAGTGNAPPTFSGYTLKTNKNTPVSIGLAKVLARASDSDGGTPSIASVSAASTQGGSVSLAASNVAYAPPLNFTGLDTFSVTIIDGQGGSVVGTVTCSVSEGNAPITNEPQITRQPGGSVALLFLGIPGQVYKVQRSTDLQVWTLLETATTASDGTLPSLDPNPPEGSAFYRIVVP